MAFKNDNFVNTVELGKAIKRRREELGLSLRDVADVTNVSASTLSRIENGTGKPDADNIARLTGWLDMPIDRVMNKQSPANVEAVVYYPHEATPEIVEAHLLLNDTTEAKHLAAKLVQEFSDAGLNRRAVAALAYLTGAIAASSATPDTVRDVHSYIFALRNDPTREFPCVN